MFFSDSVVTTGKVVSCIFFTVDKKFRMEKGFHLSSSNIVKNSWFQIDPQVSWDLSQKDRDDLHGTNKKSYELSSDGFFEESFEVIVVAFFFFSLFTVKTNVMFGTVLFPNGITQLDTTLTYGDS